MTNRRRPSRSRPCPRWSSGSPAIPATACSSPATGSPPRRRPSATACPPCRTSRPRSGRRPAPCPACPRSSCTSPTTRVVTPGDAPTVLVAMNPAALKANLADLPRGGTVIVDTDEFTKRNLAKVGYAASPLEDGSLADYLVHPVQLTSMTVEAVAKVGLQPQGRRAGQEHVRPRPAVLAVPPAAGGHPAVPGDQVRRQAGRCCGPTWSRWRPAGPTARPPRASRSTTRSSRPALPAGPVPDHPRQPGAGLRAGRGGRAVRTCRCSSAPTRSPRPPTSCTSCRALKNFGVRTFQAEDEIAGVAAALGASYGGSLGVTTTSGPGHRAQGRDDRPGRRPGTAADRRRRAARRPVHRPADQDRAGRPAAGDVRPQRRGAGAGDRRPVRRRTASTPRWRRPGSRLTYRTPVFLLSDGYLANGSEPWLIPAVDVAAGPAGRRSPRDQPQRRLERTSGPTCATRRRWPGRGRFPGTAGPGAPHRRHREGGRHRRHLLRPGQPRPHGAHPGRQGRRHRRAARWTVDDPTGDAEVLVLGWGSTFGPITGAVRALRAQGVPVAQAHLRHLNPMPANIEEVLRPLPQGGGPGDEPRASSPC